MSASWVIKNLLGTLLLPPLNGLALIALAGLFRRRRWALPLAVAGILLLAAQSLKPVADALTAPLERRAGAVFSDPAGARAIVVLGAGRYLAAPEYGRDTVSGAALARLRYGAQLARRYRLPVLVTGGKPDGGTISEADAMAEVLENEFGVPVRWREGASDDTADNAAMSAEVLRQAGIDTVVLVTHAYHMPRARRLFESAGLRVVPAPTDFYAGGAIRPHDWLPQADALCMTRVALREWIGLGWSALRGQ